MTFQNQLQDFQTKLNAFVDKAKEYFMQLNDYEKYGWIAEAIGLLLIIVGLVLFFF